MGLDASEWKPFGSEEIWGGHREYHWFDLKVTVPECSGGGRVCFEILTEKEGEWGATSPQFFCYVDGVLCQGLDVNHRGVVPFEHVTSGQECRIVPSMFTGG